MSTDESTSGMGSFCLVQYDEISTVDNHQMYEFADIDRDGMIDMLYLTNKYTMNVVVNYNMLQSPTMILEQAAGKSHFIT